MIEIVNGDLLKADLPVIAHQTNCLGVMGAGIAKSIKNKWNNVFTKYKSLCTNIVDKHNLLGKIQLCATNDTPIKEIANLFGEYSFTESVAPYENRHTDYDALRNALVSLKEKLTILGYDKVGIPYKLGCGLAGGDWNGVVYPMLQEIFNDNTITLYIYKL